MIMNKLNSTSLFLIYACATALLASLAVTAPVMASSTASSKIKNEITELQEILFKPEKSQLAILVSVNTKSEFKLESISFYLDAKKTKTYLYTERESNALVSNAMQKIYVGNISEGEHTIKAEFSAIGVNKKIYNISTTSKFTKTNTTKFVELKISKSEQQDLPVLNIKIWE